MLSQDHCQLLTAYLDGHLGARQRKAVLRLLRKSPEARELLQQLQQDAARLQALPQRHLSQDFPLQVLRTIAERGVRPTAPARPPVPVRAMPTWVAMAAAAAVLLMVTAASYLYFSHLGLEGEQNLPVAQQNAPTPVVYPQPAPGPAPALDTGLKLALRQLAEPNARAQFTQALQKDTAYHLNLGTRDNARAVEHLTTVLKTRGIKVVVDQHAQASLKKKRRTSYVLYAENIRPTELTHILQALGSEPKKAPKNAAHQGTFDNVVLQSLTSEHRQQMAKLMGIPAEQLRAPGRLPPGQDLPADLFGEHIIEAPAGSSPSTAKTRPLTPKVERYALVLASYPESSGQPGMSPEVRRFLQQRRDQQPGTLQVVLELQEVSA